MNKDNWIIKVFIYTFILSLFFSYITNELTKNTNIILMTIILILVILLGILFDMIGTSILTVKESTFHAMNAQKVKGAKSALKLIKNRVKVSSICNDIIGDICGIISGGLGAVLSIAISSKLNLSIIIITIIISALISCLTVGGKAIGKNIAYKNCDKLIFNTGKLISLIKKENKKAK